MNIEIKKDTLFYDLKQDDRILVLDTNVLIDYFDKSLNYVFQKSYWTTKLPLYLTDIIDYAFQNKKIRLCAKIPQELHGVLYNKICYRDISLYEKIVDQLRMDHKDTIIGDIIRDIQDEVIPKRTNEQKYPTRDEAWPFKKIEQVYNIIKQNHSKEYKNYIKKAKKKNLWVKEIKKFSLIVYI